VLLLALLLLVLQRRAYLTGRPPRHLAKAAPYKRLMFVYYAPERHRGRGNDVEQIRCCSAETLGVL
jgi:hypothetical protein